MQLGLDMTVYDTSEDEAFVQVCVIASGIHLDTFFATDLMIMAFLTTESVAGM